MPRILIFGCRNLGFEVARSLASDSRNIVMVDHDADRVAIARAKGFETRQARYDSDEDLKALGIGDSVTLLYALLEKDSENVFLCLSVRTLASSIRIMAVSEQTEAQQRLLAAGANKAIDPFLLSAHQVVQSMTRPLVTDMLEHTILGQQDLELAELVIPDNSPVQGQRVSQLALGESYNLVLIGLLDWQTSDKFMFHSLKEDRQLDVGDVLVVVGHDAEINQLKRALSG